MPLQFNPLLNNLPVYTPGRPIEEVARELDIPPDDIIKLASNENPMGPSPMALAAMEASLKQTHLYPDGSAFYFKQKLAAKLGLKTSNLIIGNGSNEIIEFIGHALITHDTETVVSQYCFAIYPIVTQMFGGRVVTVPARNFGHDLKAMLAAITPKTRVVFVANPNNPTGTVVSPAELKEFVDAVPDHVLVAVDEAYIEFLEDPLDLTVAIREGRNPNLILMRTFSKIYGLAGLRIGYGIGHPEVLGMLEKVRQPFNINSVVQAGALAALDDDDHIQATRQTNREGLDYYAAECKAMGVEYVPSSGNFILIRVGDGHRVFHDMQKLGVITRPMGGYQLPEWIRISVGTAQENARCVGALRKVLEAHKK